MVRGSQSKKVLVLDDEPEYQEWVHEFLRARGLQPVVVRSLQEALRELTRMDYRLIIVDMNVPACGSIEPAIETKHPLVVKYPGLIVAIEARNMGYGAHAVIAYTVHDDNAAAEELNRLYCRYVLKGRPEVFKSVVKASLAPPPIRGSRVHRIPKPVSSAKSRRRV